MMVLRRLMIAGFLLALLPAVAHAQDTENLFPQFVNGQAGGGTYYSSKLHVLPFITTPGTIDCTLRFWGMFVDMGTSTNMGIDPNESGRAGPGQWIRNVELHRLGLCLRGLCFLRTVRKSGRSGRVRFE
jgi:hypothetical protein